MSAKYHPGEIQLQERAGVRSMAERARNSIHPTIPPAAREFLEEQLMVVAGSVAARAGCGPYGFVAATNLDVVKSASCSRKESVLTFALSLLATLLPRSSRTLVAKRMIALQKR